MDRYAPEHLKLGINQDRPIRLWCRTYNRREKLPFDMHYECELGIVRKGRIIRQYHDHKIRLGPGDIWLCNMWQPHAGHITQAPCELVVFAVMPQLLMAARFHECTHVNLCLPFTTPTTDRPQADQETKRKLLELSRRAADVHCRQDLDDYLIRLRLLLIEAILVIRRNWRPKEYTRQPGPTATNRISNVIEYVLQCNHPVPAEDAARMAKMSRSHFDRLFTKLMGITFAQFELRHRLSEAADQLLQTDLPIKTIAHQFGFTDSSHFNHTFHKIYHQSPNQSRRSGNSAHRPT